MSVINSNKLPEVTRNPYLRQMSQKFHKKNSVEAKELKFALPYGHLAAKEWGDPNGLAVLAVHGWYAYFIYYIYSLITTFRSDRLK